MTLVVLVAGIAWPLRALMLTRGGLGFCGRCDAIDPLRLSVFLANLFERELGVQFNKTDLDTLRERLPKLLIEDLELVQDAEMHIDGNDVRMKFIESMYSDFCGKLRTSTNVCASLGCPICSAMACVLAQATGKPVEFDKDSYSVDGRTVETSYRILDW